MIGLRLNANFLSECQTTFTLNKSTTTHYKSMIFLPEHHEGHIVLGQVCYLFGTPWQDFYSLMTHFLKSGSKDVKRDIKSKVKVVLGREDGVDVFWKSKIQCQP